MKDHKELEVWKKSMDFVEEVYTVSRSFPKDELYGLTNQLRRASVSVPSNISEGVARHSEKEVVHYLYVALGSASEAETQLLIAQRLKFAENIGLALDRVITVKKLIYGLIKHYKAKAES